MRQSKSGFTLIAAIYLLVFVSVALALMLSYTTQSLKQTSNIYLKEQAIQLSRSATEFALLAISGHDRGTIAAPLGCVNQINASYPQNAPLFDINTTIKYFSFNLPANCNTFNTPIQTAESEGTVLIDVYVKLRLPLGSTEMPISYHKRTLQKP